MKFKGRSGELKLLRYYKQRVGAHFLALYGRRRIGKSRLVEEFINDTLSFDFIGLAPGKGINAQSQKDEFQRRLTHDGIPASHHTDWADIFTLLGALIKNQKCIVFFDEISWMGSGDPSFLPKLKTAWDTIFKKHAHLLFIACGSVSSWIEKNILSSTAFVGRVDHVIVLDPLPLPICNQFWDEKQTPAYEKFKVLSITGGIPLYLEAFDMDKSFEQNIERLCFMPGGLLLREFDSIFNDLFEQKSRVYKAILQSIVNHSLEPNKISEAINWEQSGVLPDYLHDLETAGFVCRDMTWNFKSTRPSKLSRYRISDNYTRFYLKYIEPKKDRIEAGKFLDEKSNNVENWFGVLGLQFENLVLNNREMIWRALKLSPADIVYENPCFQNKTKSQQGCQIDYLIQKKFNTLFVCEIRFSKNTINAHVIDEVKQKIARLKRPKSFSCFPVLIHINGVSKSVVESDYFSEVIAFSDMLVDL